MLRRWTADLPKDADHDPARARPRPPPTPTRPLSELLDDALATGDLAPLRDAVPVDRRDRFAALLQVYALHTAPLEQLGDRVRRWLAKEATWSELVDFLALEGGPDGGFDDLVAPCQVGLSGSAKPELGKDYWDETGRGGAAGVHTVLHRDMARAIGMPHVPSAGLPVEALERTALGGLLSTNRWLQPEMLGALGLLELQAGPRCRLVLQGFDRLGAPREAYPFYVEHAEVDPVHGKDWTDKAVVPVVVDHPDGGPRIVKGAWWRSVVNLRFFEAVRHGIVAERSGA